MPSNACVYWVTGLPAAGKTTLARCLCGLMKEKDGAILWDGKPASRKDRKRKMTEKREAGSHEEDH